MVSICVICTSRDSLEPLSDEHSGVLEMLISAAVNLSELRNLKLLVCSSCLSLIKALAKFRKTAIKGVQHLLYLSQKQLMEPEEVLIKEEPPDKENSDDTVIQMEIEPGNPECISKSQNGIKSESSELTKNWGNIEDVIPKNTIQVADTNIGKVVKAIAAYPKIKLVRQNQIITAQRLPLRFFNRPQFLPNAYNTLNMPMYPPVKLRPVKVVVMPSLQNVATKRIAPKPVAPKLMEEKKPKPRSDNNNPEMSAGQVTIEPRWYTQIVPHRKMQMQRAKERSRPDFAGAPYKCKTCILLFGSQEEMETHAKEHVLASDKLPCKVCALPIRPSDEDAHETRHTTRLQCARCTFSTEQLSVIEAHDCSSQPVKEIRNYNRRKYDTTFQCVLCRTRYSDKARLDRHNERTHKNPEVYKCNVCNQEFAGRVLLYVHKRSKHTAKDNSLDALRPELYCAECNKVFPTPALYRQHRMTRKHCPEEGYKFECDLCKRKFASKGQVKSHILGRHVVEEHVACQVCGKFLPNQFRLRRHMRAHKEKRERRRSHVCHICGKTFMIRKTLDEHVLMHSGLRPHACPLCPATFTYSASLFTHNQLKHLKIKRNWKKTKKDTSREK